MKESVYDELAGIADMFDVLTRAELERALDELAFKKGKNMDDEAVASAVESAVRDYYLVTYDDADGERVVAGPVAFPTLPENAEDLPHILDVDDRTVDHEAVTEATADRLRADAEAAIASGDDERIRHLLDVTYDVELWASRDVDVSEVRARLDAELDD
jgi:prophage tail gpP-like protein